MTNLLDFGMDPQEALDAPRSFAWEGDLQLETGYREDVAAELAALGRRLAPARRRSGGAGDRDRGDGVLAGASDPRKDGCALGIELLSVQVAVEVVAAALRSAPNISATSGWSTGSPELSRTRFCSET